MGGGARGRGRGRAWGVVAAVAVALLLGAHPPRRDRGSIPGPRGPKMPDKLPAVAAGVYVAVAPAGLGCG